METFLQLVYMNQGLLELCLAGCFIVFSLPRRKNFLLRLILCVCGALAINSGLSYLFRLLAVSGAFGVFSSVLLAIVVVYVLFASIISICFKCNIGISLFVTTFAYVIQQGFNRFGFVLQYVFLDNIGIEWLNYLSYWLLTAVYYTAVYFLITRKLYKTEIRIDNRRTILIMLIYMITTILSFILTLIFRISGIIEQPMVGFFYTALLAVLICPLLLFNLMDSLSKKQMEHEIVMIKALWEADRKQYEFAKKNIDIINIKYHDLKYQKYVNKYGEEPETDDEPRLAIIQTNNESLDVVLTEKYLSCTENGINLISIADGSALSKINPSDIYSLFGNAIDNAVECLRGVDDESKKTIELSVKQINEMIHIQIDNFIPQVITIKDGLPQTTKVDSENHGFGLKSMRMIAEKYKGTMLLNIQNETFSLQFLLPVK